MHIPRTSFKTLFGGPKTLASQTRSCWQGRFETGSSAKRYVVLPLLLALLTTSAFGQEVPPNPFKRQVDMPKLPGELEWLNTSGPIQLDDLRGKFVIFDFWTYCCINCIHVLPELKKLEHEFSDELVVIGVHSAKFENERKTKNIEEAILRYEIEHPVINDPQMKFWQMVGVQGWPTILVIDPEGKAVFMRSGEFRAEQMSAVLKKAIAHYDAKGVMDRTPIQFDLLAHRQTPSTLRFPGKILADGASKRLYISDSNHNRIVITDLEGNFIETIGSGKIGNKNGSFAEASFDHPQGTVLVDNTLYIADTENHLIRAADLKRKRVRTIAGTGTRGRNPWPGSSASRKRSANRRRWRGKPTQTAINSPWDLWSHENHIYIAMAGPHQIWWMPTDTAWIAPYAGNAREDIVDGPLLPSQPYERDASSFAQPSGLTSDGFWLYVADSEGSSIRAVPLNPRSEVKTVVGTSSLERRRLFQFGDVDGAADAVRLQHPLGVAFHDSTIYVADTYNDKIKAVDADSGETVTIAGNGEPGNGDDPAQFDEPAGLSCLDGKLYVADTNNHAIRVIDLDNDNRVTTLELKNVPGVAIAEEKAAESTAMVVETVKPQVLAIDSTNVTFETSLPLSEGQKLNELAPISFRLSTDVEGIFDAKASTQNLPNTSSDLKVSVPLRNARRTNATIRVEYVYCETGSEGLCKINSIEWKVPLDFTKVAETSNVNLNDSADE
ncbi:thioredoxin-like domain-containing protein [Planctomycetota bacterium]